MSFGEETEKERLLRYMKIPAKKKLEWLYEVNRFFSKALSRRKKILMRKLKEGP